MDLEKVPVIGSTAKFLDGFGIEYGLIVFVAGVGLFIFGLNAIDVPQSKVVSFLFTTAPIWLPYLTFHLFFDKYTEMVGKKFSIKSGRQVLEILLPPEVFKSPEAMENVLTQVFNAANPDNLMETYIDGKRPLPYTFELVSRGGDVHFYATLPLKNVNALSDNMYAQYPGVEVKKLDLDYTAEVPTSLTGWSFMSFHFQKKKDSPIPIKTYIELGMDKLPKEEEKLDPMTPMLEVLAGIQPHQQVWFQFICTAHRDKNFKNGQLHAAGTWEKDIHATINEMMMRDPKTKTGMPDLEGMPRVTTGERNTIEIMERMAGKYAFEFAGRMVYLSSKEGDYDGALFSRLIRSIAQTEVKDRNGLGIRWRTDFDYKMFSDPFGKKVPALKHEEIKEYKMRVLHPKSSAMSIKIISVEELATIFHLPGGVAGTPTLNRVTSTRRDAPSNLPTGNLPI